MHEERWLVKSSGRIMGPFTLEELIQHLRARTLSVIDEVRDPATRWSFIREHPLLKDVVRQLRDEDETHHDATQTTFVGGRTMTMSLSDTAGQEGEFTPNPTVPTPGYQNRSTDSRPISAVERTVKPTFGGPRTFGSLQDQRVQGQIERKQAITRGLVWFLALALIVSTSWFFYSQKRNKVIAQDLARQFVQVAHEQVRYGQMAKALEFIQKAAAVNALAPEDQILQSELLVQVDGQANEAHRILGEVKNVTEPRLVREMSLARILVDMKDQHLNEATVELNTLLELHPGDEEALHNQALLQFFHGYPAAAWKTATELTSRGYSSSTLLMLKGMMALNWPDKGNETLRVNQATDDLKRDLEESYELRFEKNLVLMNLRLKSGKMEEALKLLGNLWKADPFDSRNFLLPLTVDQQILSWDRLFPLCEQIYRTIPDHEGSQALRAVCLYQKGETALALQKIDESRKQLSQSPLIAAVQALLYSNVGRVNEAKTLIQLAQKEPLGQLVLGQICQKDKDWVCADQAWSAALGEDQKNPMALFGQAFVAKQRGNDLSSREQLRHAVLASPHYRPFLEFRGDSNVF